MFIHKEMQSFISISRFAGERYDLIQAGGGNSSVKSKDSRMLIKASGHLLSDINEHNGYVEVNYKKVLAVLDDPSITMEENKKEREEKADLLMKESIVQLDNRKRPSIETFLHAILYKYTLHTHPIAVNMVTCKKEWRELLRDLFPDALFVNYQTPGIDLALELKKECDNYQREIGQLPKIIFLQNHGLIVSSTDAMETLSLTNNVVLKIEKALNIDLLRYRLTNELTTIMGECGNGQVMSYLSEDHYLLEKIDDNLLFNSPPLCPDTLVFCGYHAVKVNDYDERHKIKEYYATYHKFPKVVMYKDHLFFVSNTIKKAKETEEVLKAHIITLEHIIGHENSLPLEELKHLDNWEAEKFRQGV